MAGGRPTDYTPELLEAAMHYATDGWIECKDAVPTVAGLACEIGVSRETCYAWARDDKKKAFSDILHKIAQTQERKLVNGGILGEFNAPITKMMLTKHGYSDRIEQDHSSKDGSMTPTRIELVAKTNDDSKD